MKVFVTGVAGQLGHDVINELTERTSNQAGNYTCTGSDLAPEYSGAQDGTAVTKAPYVSLDITDEAAVEVPPQRRQMPDTLRLSRLRIDSQFIEFIGFCRTKHIRQEGRVT